MITFFGQPEEAWIGRTVFLLSPHKGKCSIRARIVGFTKRGVLVKIATEGQRVKLVSRKRVRPWWSRNSDLATAAERP